VVAEAGADLAQIEHTIKTMPGYFADYDTTVEFISQQQLEREHMGLPHGGHVIRTGTTGWDNESRQRIEYSLQLDSNPQFTSSVLVACARAAVRMRQRGITGCVSMFDIAPADLSILSREELLKTML
jgi:diaminopimelate dehydrogenase